MSEENYPIDRNDLFALMGILNSSQATVALKEINPGRFFQASYVNSLRLHKSWKSKKGEFEKLSQRAYDAQRSLSQINETSTIFCRPVANIENKKIIEYANSLKQELQQILGDIDAVSSFFF